MKHIQIRVFGKVQGVWFRKSTMEMAQQINVNGIVMNEADGSVYIEAEASAEALEQFVAYCHKGPEHAEVSNVILSDGILKNYIDFKIIH